MTEPLGPAPQARQTPCAKATAAGYAGRPRDRRDRDHPITVTSVHITLRPAARYSVSASLQKGAPPDSPYGGGLCSVVDGISPYIALYSTENRPNCQKPYRAAISVTVVSAALP
jgi:hypothetical protein